MVLQNSAAFVLENANEMLWFSREAWTGLLIQVPSSHSWGFKGYRVLVGCGFGARFDIGLAYWD